MSQAEVKVNTIKFQKLYPIDLADNLQSEYVFLKQCLTFHENKMSLRQLKLFIKPKDLKEAFHIPTEIALATYVRVHRSDKLQCRTFILRTQKN